jgi:nitrile hydratase accessory protein
LSTREQEDRQPRSADSARLSGEERPFNEPWEAEALALALALQEAGRFTATEWSATLGAEIARAQADGDPDDGTTYYRHVLAALERLASEKGLVGPDALLERRQAWENAYRRTPHGQPVTLSAAEDPF